MLWHRSGLPAGQFFPLTLTWFSPLALIIIVIIKSLPRAWTQTLQLQDSLPTPLCNLINSAAIEESSVCVSICKSVGLAVMCMSMQEWKCEREREAGTDGVLWSACLPFVIYCKQLFSIDSIADLVWMTGCRRIFTHHMLGFDDKSSSSAHRLHFY